MNLNIKRTIFAILTIATCIIIFIFSNQNGEKSGLTSRGFVRKIVEITGITNNLNETEKEELIEIVDFLKKPEKFNKMGAKITAQGKSAFFEGVKELKGAPVYASDLRAGAALIVAGIIAKGTTDIYNLEYIDRGYENIEQKFRDLGAKIKRVEED